jgi:hypothetical protein
MVCPMRAGGEDDADQGQPHHVERCGARVDCNLHR